MPKKGWLTKTLAIAGTFLAWLPMLTMVYHHRGHADPDGGNSTLII